MTDVFLISAEPAALGMIAVRIGMRQADGQVCDLGSALYSSRRRARSLRAEIRELRQSCMPDADFGEYLESLGTSLREALLVFVAQLVLLAELESQVAAA